MRGAEAMADAFRGLAPSARVAASHRTDEAQGVRRFGAIIEQMADAQRALRHARPRSVLTLGGDCAVDIAVVDYLVGIHPDLTVVWIDTHLDANTTATSPSGCLHGMPVAAIMGHPPAGMRDLLAHPLHPTRFRYAHAHVGDAGDWAFVKAFGLEWLAYDDVIAGPVHVHFDLDVLDPAAFPYLAYPDRDGLSVATARTLLRRLGGDAEVVGLTFTEFAPADAAAAKAGAVFVRSLFEDLVGAHS